MSDTPATPTAARKPPPRACFLVGWLAMFFAAGALYVVTANRGAQWQDSGEIALRIWQGELVNVRGLALTHPLHYWLGRMAIRAGQTLEPVFAITLISAVAAALAVANLFGCVLSLTWRLPAALFAAVSLAFANTFWRLATVTEVYTLTAALLAAECWALVALARTGGRWTLWLLFLLNGLSVANHLQGGLTTPVLLVVAGLAVRAGRVRWFDAAFGAVLWLLGSLPYTWLVVCEGLQTGQWAATLQSALVGERFGGKVLNTALSFRLVGVSAAFIAFNFPNLLLPAAAWGLARRPSTAGSSTARRPLLAILVIHAVFALRYNVPDQYTFFLPMYVLLCIFGGVGAAVLLEASSRLRTPVIAAAVVMLAATPLVYHETTRHARQQGWFSASLHHKPYRDDYTYLFIPWAVVDRSADEMSRAAVELAAPDGLVIVEDSMARFAIEYRALREGWDKIDVRVWPGLDHYEAAEDLSLRAVATFYVDSPVVLVPLNKHEPAVPPPMGQWYAEGEIFVLDVPDETLTDE